MFEKGNNVWMKFVRFGFRLLYQELAWSYDLVSWLVSLGEWRHWQRAGLSFLSGRRILEVGHGPGHMLLALENAGVVVFGLDLSAQMGRIARKRLVGKGSAARLARGRVQRLPFAAGAFDAIFSTFPTEYIVDEKALAEFARVLGENGRIVIVPEGHLTGRGPLQALIAWAFRITGQRSGPFAVDAAQQWPADSIWNTLRNRFHRAGFSLTLQRIRRRRSRVTVLVAEKNDKGVES